MLGEPGVEFVRRIVTRKALADAEDHASLDRESFAAAEAAGEFAFTWRAHGLCYAFPSSLKNHLANGGVAVANGSRATLERLAEAFPGLVVVSLKVSRERLAERLAARGRETPAEIEDRLSRAERYRVDAPNCVTISNDGAVEKAGDALVDLVRMRLGQQLPAAS